MKLQLRYDLNKDLVKNKRGICCGTGSKQSKLPAHPSLGVKRFIKAAGRFQQDACELSKRPGQGRIFSHYDNDRLCVGFNRSGFDQFLDDALDFVH
jgi:hypothetical protein